MGILPKDIVYNSIVCMAQKIKYPDENGVLLHIHDIFFWTTL